MHDLTISHYCCRHSLVSCGQRNIKVEVLCHAKLRAGGTKNSNHPLLFHGVAKTLKSYALQRETTGSNSDSPGSNSDSLQLRPFS